MLTFDYLCNKCGCIKHNEIVRNFDDKVFCDECQNEMEKYYGDTVVNTSIFPSDGVYLEHVSPEGKTFHSKQEMKDYARKNDLELGYLE